MAKEILQSQGLKEALQAIYLTPCKTRSDFAREHVEDIGILACLGFITLKQGKDVWGREWRVTVKGLEILENYDDNCPC
ncbi:hypothetical protein BSL82_03490 [Tardibacter chloracetimidivorans]|uniref:Uncharacterized protein n=1 Tax=Tardibacter chloracetimidivorans TaxID=1921510 RepID=A0A1L3ZS68_9SPHN|nr:hypothetical protein BSL82_03490 [Tardibacter chloracetimidivorans]